MLPKGCLVARGSDDLLVGDQNLKQGAGTGCLKLIIFTAIASIPTSSEGTTEFPAHFEQVSAAKGVTL